MMRVHQSIEVSGRDVRVEARLQDPEAFITPLGGSELWQAALLESWLQAHQV